MQSHNNTRCIRNSRIRKVGNIVCLKIEISMIETEYGYILYIKWKILQIDKSFDNIESNYNIYFYLESVQTIENFILRNVISYLRKQSFRIF